MRVFLRSLSAALALCANAAPALAASTAFRLVDLDLRDPHAFVELFGCHDITDNTSLGVSVNGELQSSIQADGGGDGLLDLSLLVVFDFDPLDPAGPGGPMRFGKSSCTAPLAGTSCGPSPYESLLSLAATNGTSGTCLVPLPGTTHGYSPAIATPAAPCFASSEAPLVAVDLFGGGTPINLRYVRVAATYSGGSPPTSLTNGLLLGFLTEADANATLLPSSYPLIGGRPVASLLPGGQGSCTGYSDKDTGPAGEAGWWMYFNFTAEQVPYSGPGLAVEDAGGFRLALASPNPGRAPVAIACRLGADGPVSVTVHDLAGRRVAELLGGWQPAGERSLAWDGRLAAGGAAAPGLYVVRLSSAQGTLARKVLLLR